MNLQGKIIQFLGDSITEGYGVSDVKYRYDSVLKETAGLKAIYNDGIGGTRLAHQTIPSDEPKYDLTFCGRANELHSDADIIVVFGGTNDYGHGDAPFGTMQDATPASFCGAVEFLMTFLKNKYPNATTVFMTPARRVGDLLPSDSPWKRGAQPLKDYASVIIEKGKQHDIPVLNLYEKLGIDPNNELDRTRYTIDGLHLNDEGHAVLSALLKEFLESL